jgi:hypothetical protein
MKKVNQPVFRFITRFFRFLFFQKKNLNFLNCNQLIFSEPKKLVRTTFIGFHENRPIFIDVVIHGDGLLQDFTLQLTAKQNTGVKKITKNVKD